MDIKIRKDCPIALNTARLAIRDFKSFPCMKNWTAAVNMTMRASGLSRAKVEEALLTKIPQGRTFATECA
jgi:hypothetical protein